MLAADGTVWAWGSNSRGMLGDGSTTSRSSPVLVGGDFRAIGVGLYSSYGVKTDGSLWAWGANSQGELGDGTTIDRGRPVRIGEQFAAVAAGWSSAVGLKRDGSVWTWGANVFGTLGNGRLDPHVVATPQPIGSGFSAVHTSKSHVLALKPDGSLWAWGANFAGEVGTGDFAPRALPTLIGSGYRAVSAGEDFSLAIKQDGSLWAWGWNSYASLGLGRSGTSKDPEATEVTSYRAHPERVAGRNYVAVTNGSYHAHALTVDGRLWGWGMAALGAVGDGLADSDPDGTGRLVFEPKPIAEGFWKLANGGGNNNGFGIKWDGSVWAWGTNAGGQLGDGTMQDSLAPKPIGFNVFPAGGIVRRIEASGPPTALRLTGEIAPNRDDAGKPGCVFVAAVLTDGSVYWLGPSGWVPHSPEHATAFGCARMVAYAGSIARDADVTRLRGTVLYLGYGLGATPELCRSDMNRRQLVGVAHVVQ